MRWRGVTVLTNTPPRSFAEFSGRHAGHRHHGTGAGQGRAKARHRSGRHPSASTRPEGKAPIRPAGGRQAAIRDQRVHQGSPRARLRAVQMGGEKSEHRQAQRLQGPRRGVSVSCYVGGSIGFDGLFVIKPDGRIYIQSGVGNLGTESWSDVHRVVAELLGVPWEKCELTWGNSSKNLPWTCPSGGSQTTHAMTRAAHAMASDANPSCRRSRPKISAASRKTTRWRSERVSRKGGGPGMTLAHAAQRAIQLGGSLRRPRTAPDINKLTVASATALRARVCSR